MVGFGVSELFLLVLLGSSPADLVSLIHADDYFQVRKIDLTVENMVELAGKDPTSAKAQIQQLLALRVLGDDVDEVNKSAQRDAVLKLLRQIADGAKAQDPQGFAKEYAAKTLARLEGKTITATPLPKDSVRKDAFAWFPAGCTVVGAIDMRGAGGVTDEIAAVRKLITAKIPPQTKEEIYSGAESLGNIRIDRTSFGVVHQPNSDHKARIFIRFTGAGDRQRLIDMLEKVGGWKATRRDTTVVLQQVQQEDETPALAFIGDDDVVITGFANRKQLDNMKLVDELLAVRAKTEGSVLSGKLKDQLEKTPADSNGVLIGTLPDEFRREMTRGGGISNLPENVVVNLKRGKTTQIDFSGVMNSEDDAKTLSNEIANLRQQGIDALKKVPAQVGVPARIIDNLRKSLESIQANSAGKSIEGSGRIDGSIAELIPYLLLAERSESKIEPPAQPKR